MRQDAFDREITIERPSLPTEIDWLEVRKLEVAGERVDLVFQRNNGRVVASATSRVSDNLRVTIRL